MRFAGKWMSSPTETLDPAERHALNQALAIPVSLR